MKTIPLTNSDQFALVDDDMLEYLMQWRWNLHSMGYAARCIYTGNYRSASILMHRIVIGLPPQDRRNVDHIDNNPLNNQRANLRIATQSQNMANKRISKVGMTSQYRGVSWYLRDGIWQATIMYRRQQYYLGRFVNELDAAKAYNEKALELFGEFARLNIFDTE